jgi:hypothetical protein
LPQIRLSSLHATMNPLFAPPSQISRVCSPSLGISFCTTSPKFFRFPLRTITAANRAISTARPRHFYLHFLSFTHLHLQISLRHFQVLKFLAAAFNRNKAHAAAAPPEERTGATPPRASWGGATRGESSGDRCPGVLARAGIQEFFSGICFKQLSCSFVFCLFVVLTALFSVFTNHN